MADSSFYRASRNVKKTLAAAAALGDLQQLADGSAASVTGSSGNTGDVRGMAAENQWTCPKTTGVVILNGGRVFWDRTARKANYFRSGNRDYYLGRAVGDAASASASMVVELGIDPAYDVDLARDSFVSALIGTAGSVQLNRRGGAHNLVLGSTNEAQKVDALSRALIGNLGNAIVELACTVNNGSAGSAPDFSIGLASATHATDASSIAQRLFCHLDGNSTNINFESADGTTTVAITDSTADYVVGTRFEVWLDMRDPASVIVYVNGVRVLPGSVFNVNAAASGWKLLAHLEKTSATDACEIDVDWLRVRTSDD